MTVVRDAFCVTLAALMLGGIAAGAVLAYDLAPGLRAWFGLTPEHPVDVSPGTLFANNMGVVATILLAALLVATSPRLRPVGDAWVILIVGFNVLVTAVALAAYGGPLLRLAPAHYALELLALATAAAVYLDARRAWRGRVVVAGAVAVTVLLLVGAIVESPH